ncbi:hypothetical protein JCM10213_008379 [Rhodosporidiobolus nylandii]
MPHSRSSAGGSKPSSFSSAMLTDQHVRLPPVADIRLRTLVREVARSAQDAASAREEGKSVFVPFYRLGWLGLSHFSSLDLQVIRSDLPLALWHAFCASPSSFADSLPLHFTSSATIDLRPTSVAAALSGVGEEGRLNVTEGVEKLRRVREGVEHDGMVETLEGEPRTLELVAFFHFDLESTKVKHLVLFLDSAVVLEEVAPAACKT